MITFEISPSILICPFSSMNSSAKRSCSICANLMTWYIYRLYCEAWCDTNKLLFFMGYTFLLICCWECVSFSGLCPPPIPFLPQIISFFLPVWYCLRSIRGRTHWCSFSGWDWCTWCRSSFISLYQCSCVWCGSTTGSYETSVSCSCWKTYFYLSTIITDLNWWYLC